MIMIKLKRLSFKKRALQNVEPAEIKLFFLAGQISNEITVLVRHIIFISDSRADSRPELDAKISEYMLYIRILASKVFEGVEAINSTIAPVRSIYVEGMSPEQRAQLKRLSRAISGSGLIREIRNKVGFHYSSALIMPALERIPDREEFVEYHNINFGNTLYRCADAIALRALLMLSRGGDEQQAIDAIINEVVHLANALSTVSNRITQIFVGRHLRKSLEDMRDNELEVDAPPLLEVEIPFFCEPPTPEEMAKWETGRKKRVTTAMSRRE